jgi:integrase
MAREPKKRSQAKDGLWLRGRVWWTRINGERISTGCKDREAARVWRAAREREAANPANAAAAKETIDDMIRMVLEDRAHANGRTGTTVCSQTLSYYETKLGHISRILGRDTPLSTVDYVCVGRYLAQRKDEGASQLTRHKELTAFRLGLRLEKQGGRYPHDVDYVTRAKRFAQGYVPRQRYLTWEEIPKLLTALLVRAANCVPPERIQRARQLRAAGKTLREVAEELGVTPQSASRYFADDAGQPTQRDLLRAQRIAWFIATAGRASEMRRAEMEDHALERWAVRIRRTKTGGGAAWIPIAPPFRRILEFALHGRPNQGALYPPISNGSLNRMLRLACKRAGIERVSPNDLRRTHASLLRQAGIALEDIAPILGHTSTEMLQRVYGRTNVEALGRALARVQIPKPLARSTILSHIRPSPRKTA